MSRFRFFVWFGVTIASLWVLRMLLVAFMASIAWQDGRLHKVGEYDRSDGKHCELKRRYFHDSVNQVWLIAEEVTECR
jgi:hypothetical protein